MNNISKIDEINSKIAFLTNEVKKQSEEVGIELSSNINENLNKLRFKLDSISLIDELNRSKIVYSIADLNNVIVKYGISQDTILVKKIVDLWNNLEQIKKLTNDKNDIIIKCLSNVINNEILQSIIIDVNDDENLKMKKTKKSPDELYENYLKAKNLLRQTISIDEAYITSKKLLDELFFSYTGIDIENDENKEKLTRS